MRFSWTILLFLVYQLVTAQSLTEKVSSAISKKDFKESTPIARRLIKSEIAEDRAYGFWALGVAHLSNNPYSANYYLTNALSEKPTDALRLKILSAQANYFDITGHTRKAIQQFLSLIDLAERHDPSMLSGIYNNLCIGYRTLESFDSAVYYGLQGLDKAKKYDQPFETKRLYNSIAISFAVQGDLAKAGGYFRKSLDQALINSDSSGASKGFVNLTQLKIYQDDLDSAIYFLDLAKLFNQRNRNVLDIVDSYALLADVSQEPHKAIGYLERAIDELSGLSYPSEEMALLLNLSQRNLDIGNYQESQERLDQVTEILSATEGQSELLAAKNLQKDLLVMTGKYKEALALQDEIDSLSALRFNLARTRAVEDMRVKYETAEKEQQIRDLEQRELINELRIRQQNTLLIGGGAIVLVLVLIAYAFYRNRSLRQEQQRLVLEQRLLRSQMKPHFLFNALSSINSFIFKGDQKEASAYLTTFSELTRDILDNSSQEWVTLDKELKTLAKYVEVQRLRFPEINYVCQIEEQLEVDNVLFPPLLLQPFMENSIEHGFKGRYAGNIEIKVSSQHSQLFIDILDDGKGFSLSDQSSHDSKAIAIASERLDVLFGRDKAQLTIKNRAEWSGVIVSIVLPKIEAI